ncbi:tRNA (adenosine(37)-N6)-threonylcarbamoyltransferase complex ATPase subunit type 1 TsaE [Candidatus Berkelbacteria bacterium CG_4_9_14_3_um_filter_39_23]|uniref:tRNA threonylcarbamoyladenosine biosynthesis protein TsaE n=2 Tax=Candidatus Berkelbacteria TaxID=1618330 RepID=A0A2M7CHT7_9BACT|nr:MAG: tRNA (adenosine(37)-N6)-threonylcarbamoyltransferase complex ATPase subunit type 1 TsaE [Candidatus Berkelbacteria bacterium CG2_30_39_44]PIR28208.1 MAG: tRNA (adenosine(37)-N6)-threonylcarbamoyltransferase complex ATPase subunit type 1 TsaE [Candidatus Berkelbacteria bacterium CG11_big_fil_rev_8_21_14_0_20_40_23]PIV25168.1 MAG: tRNA (adenosine(37)-N6)-threonylcarbamoyltransferase complex ATPase subunit type 1 TsaE [Candidatus Berkelbacteria bacterium CG03_land_8_20_14_0_80_40_36]PIZ2866
MATYYPKNALDTKRIARKLWQNIRQAKIVFLSGPLGAGKTFFVKQLGKVLGIKEEIISPSFQLIKVYSIQNTNLRLVHTDLFRLDIKSQNDFLELFEYLGDEKNIVLIEWGEKIANFIKPKMTIEFSGIKKRKIKVKNLTQICKPDGLANLG